MEKKKNDNMLMLIKFKLALLMFLVVFAIPCSAAARVGIPACDVNGVMIYVQEIDGDAYLMLPSMADYSALNVVLPDGSMLISSDGNRIIDSDTAESGSINFHEFLGLSLVAGKKYHFSFVENGNTETITVMKSENLMTTYISLNDGKTVSFLNESKENKATGSLVMINANGSTRYSGNLSSVKGRGNTSFTKSGDKKPYNIKLETKAELIKGAGKAKNWCLINDNVSSLNDRTGLCNITAYQLYDAMGGNQALKTESTDLYINGEYRGTYLMTEKVEVGSSRVNITETKNLDDKEQTTMIRQSDTILNNLRITKVHPDECVTEDNDPAILSGIQAYSYATNSTVKTQGGYLIELDNNYFYDEASWFVTSHGEAFVLKSPEYATKEQVQKIAIRVQAFEDALYSSTGYNSEGIYYTEYIDLESLVQRYVLDTFLQNGDMLHSSAYFYIDDLDNPDDKICSGPAWDYDYSYQTYVEILNVNGRGSNLWAERLLTHGDFADAVKSLICKVQPIFQDWANIGLDQVVKEQSSSRAMNKVMWDANFPGRVPTLVSEQCDAWYGSRGIYSGKYLESVTTLKEGSTYKAVISGRGGIPTWYKVDSSNPTKSSLAKGKTSNLGKTFVPSQEDGIYYCKVIGKSVDFDNLSLEGLMTMCSDPK